MSSHHYHHHHQNHSSCKCCCCCCSSTPPSSPPLTTSDQLLQLLLLQQTLNPHPLNPHHRSQPIKPPNPRESHYHNDQQNYHERNTQSLHSLIRRVAALESSLSHLSLSSPHNQPPAPPSRSPPPPPPPPGPPPLSLRDLAARVIQSRFRRFLVRRSEALRHLKRLAAIKSHAADLRSSLLDKTQNAPTSEISKRAMDLLRELDSIQSGDPTIREGRRSIGRELVRILEFVDKVLAKEQLLMSAGAMVTAGVEAFEGDDGAQTIRASKRVSFADDYMKSRVSAGDEHQHSSIRGLENRGGYSRVFDEEGREAHLGPEGLEVSDDEENPNGVAEAGGMYGRGGQLQGQNGNLGLYAPLPVQMEPRRRC